MADSEGQSGEQKLKLMVVDDESDNLDLLYRTFRREFEVFKAESGLKALQLLDEVGEMAVIISDQRMPRMNGTELLSRTVERFPDTIRILLTGYTDVEDLVGAINAGKVFKYVTKPWSPEALKQVVGQAADTYRLLKQRTHELQRALRRESLFNAVTTAIRESLDYQSMLQTIVATLGQTFAADLCTLHPIEPTSHPIDGYDVSPQVFAYAAPHLAGGNGTCPMMPLPSRTIVQQALASGTLQSTLVQDLAQSHSQLVIPLAYQQEVLAVLILHRQGNAHPWSSEEMQLIGQVAEQAALAISQAKLYQQTQQQTEQMRAELVVARQIQMNLLRQSWPELDSARVQAYCYPAREVGGDFFEVFMHPQGNMWLAVGDVSGKGVPAALFMASAISLLRRELSQEVPPEPDVIMQNLNSSLSDDLVGSNCFITMVLARYNPTTRELVYANAGHIYPLVWSRQYGDRRETAADLPEPNYLKVRGVPLGILPVWKAAAGSLKLNPGEVMLLTSDGITEATIACESGTSNCMLQQAGLWQLLAQQSDELNLANLLAQIQSETQVQEDDQTILSLEVL